MKSLDSQTPSRVYAAWTCAALVATMAGARALAADPTAPVAEPPVPVTVTPAAPVSRVDLQAQFRKEFDAKNFEAAAALAKTLAELTEKEVGTQGEELQVALMNLATSQYLAGDYVGAEASYLRAIELTEASANPRVERLARANAGLAATYYAGKRYDLAVARFQKAVAFNRRSEGLLSESQLPLLDRFASALTELGRYDEALQVQKYVLRIAERKYGERDSRMAPTLEKIARWYTRVGAYEQSLSTLRRTINIVEDAEGEKSPNLVGPLTAVADCARQELLDPAMLARASPEIGGTFYQDPNKPPPFSPSATAALGQKALDRAVAIATERPDPLPLQIADVRTQYGDWFETRSQPSKALPQYQLAWQEAVKVPYKGKTLADALFAKPVLLNYNRPVGWDRYASRPASEILLKAVTLETTVNANGSTSDAKVIDDSGDPRRADQALRALATAHYRPRFENGQAVATPGVQFTQIFQVLPPKEATPGEPAPDGAPPAEPAPPTAPQKDKSP